MCSSAVSNQCDPSVGSKWIHFLEWNIFGEENSSGNVEVCPAQVQSFRNMWRILLCIRYINSSISFASSTSITERNRGIYQSGFSSCRIFDTSTTSLIAAKTLSALPARPCLHVASVFSYMFNLCLALLALHSHSAFSKDLTVGAAEYPTSKPYAVSERASKTHDRSRNEQCQQNRNANVGYWRRVAVICPWDAESTINDHGRKLRLAASDSVKCAVSLCMTRMHS